MIIALTLLMMVALDEPTPVPLNQFDNGDAFAKCFKDKGSDVSYCTNDVVSSKDAGVRGACCAEHYIEEYTYCPTDAYCKPYYSHDDAYIRQPESWKEEDHEFCGKYCDNVKEKPGWCPGLSAGAIAGIVIAAVVVVGAIVGAAVFFLVCKKNGDD